MPMYGRSTHRKPTRARRTYRRPAAKKGPAVYRRKRIPLAKRSTLMRLKRQVAFNTRQAQGRRQLSYQCLKFTELPTVTSRAVTDVQTHMFVVQGIQAGTPVYAPVVASGGPPPTPYIISVQKIAAWENCQNPAIKLNSAYTSYDQLKYFTNNLGVQPVYCHYSSDYCFNFLAKDCVGWIEISMVEYRRQTTPGGTPNDQFVLPSAALSMINLAQGSNDQYMANPYYFKRRRLVRKYFNTAAHGPAGHTIGTQPNFSVRLKIKNPKFHKLVRLRANEMLTPAPATLPKTDWDTIGRNVQRWLQVSCTIEDTANTSSAGITYECYRLNDFRDMIGSVN